jgi:serine/threonine protein kinase
LLDAQGDVWVTDFGLAKTMGDDGDLTRTGDMLGTLRYMAPERFQGTADVRADVYSLGLTLYERLTFRPAFHGDDRESLVARVTRGGPPTPRSLNPSVTRDLETVVLKAIAREPSHRYATPGELVEDLQRFVDDRPVRARLTSLPSQLAR